MRVRGHIVAEGIDRHATGIEIAIQGDRRRGVVVAHDLAVLNDRILRRVMELVVAVIDARGRKTGFAMV